MGPVRVRTRVRRVQDRPLDSLVRAHFDETRYKNKKPIPTNNTYIAVEGFLNNVIVDSKSGTSTIFHFSVDNISFLGKAVLPNKCKSR